MAGDIAKTTADFITKQSVTEHDAVHPRFQDENEEEVRQCQLQRDYYCEQCRLFIAPSVIALKIHFRGDIVKHEACGTCFYCRGPCFEYKWNEKCFLYHICRKEDIQKGK